MKVKTGRGASPVPGRERVAIPIPSYEGQDPTPQVEEEPQVVQPSQYLFLLMKVKTGDVLTSYPGKRVVAIPIPSYEGQD